MNLPSPQIAIALFFLGGGLLYSVARAIARTHRFHRNVEHAWKEVCLLLDHRSEQLRRLILSAHGVADFAPDIEEMAAALGGNDGEDADRTGKEQTISRILARMAARMETKTGRKDGSATGLADRVVILLDEEIALAAAREHYNEIASAWNTYRRPFPAGLLARALGYGPAPTFPSIP
ncbi:MAG: LemA family protein [Capsulimonadales bacterium]|nr:LemA family protein [Capsulimonadales bacterium]